VRGGCAAEPLSELSLVDASVVVTCIGVVRLRCCTVCVGVGTLGTSMVGVGCDDSEELGWTPFLVLTVGPEDLRSKCGPMGIGFIGVSEPMGIGFIAVSL